MLIFNEKQGCLEVTVVYESKKSDIEKVFLVSNFGLQPVFHMLGKFSMGQKQLELNRDKNKHQITLCLPYNTLTTYNLKVVFKNGESQVIIDPSNRDKIAFINDYFPKPEISTNSIIKDPKMEFSHLDQSKSNLNLVKGVEFYSKILKNTRNLWFYLPPNHNPTKKYKLALFFDGLTMIDTLPVVKVIHQMIESKQIRDYVVVFIGNIDWNTRKKELRLNNDYHKFLTKELIPFVDENYSKLCNINAILGGFSYGGLASFYHAMKNPELFTRVISISGDLTANLEPINSFSEHLQTREAIINLYVKKDKSKLPKRVYQMCGLFENKPGNLTTILTSNREMNTLLNAKRVKNKYIEYNGGHDLLHAHNYLEDMIEFCFG